MRQLLDEFVQYRELIWALALKDLRVRYKRSMLGFLWALLNPLFMMLILTLVFTTVMPIPINHYSVFLLSALLPWTFFQQALSYSAEAIVSNADLLKKLYVGKSVFLVAAIEANLINFLLSLIPLVIIVFAVHFPFHWTWIYLPVPLIGLIAFTLGFGFFCAAANVFFRDVTHITQIVLQAWFYLCPIIYSVDMVPKKFGFFFRFNPIVYSLNEFRLAIYYGLLPSAQSVAMTLGVGFASLYVGYRIFRRYQGTFVYYL